MPRQGAAFEAPFAVAQDKQGAGVLRPYKGENRITEEKT